MVLYKGRPRDILPRIIPYRVNGIKIGRLTDWLYLLGRGEFYHGSIVDFLFSSWIFKKKLHAFQVFHKIDDLLQVSFPHLTHRQAPSCTLHLMVLKVWHIEQDPWHLRSQGLFCGNLIAWSNLLLNFSQQILLLAVLLLL